MASTLPTMIVLYDIKQQVSFIPKINTLPHLVEVAGRVFGHLVKSCFCPFYLILISVTYYCEVYIIVYNLDSDQGHF